MTHLLPSQATRRLPGDGFWRKTWAMLVKEFIQLKRDRVSLAMIIMIPLVQLMLFGYAINTMPRNLPTAVLIQESSDLSRSILAALENTKFFKVTQLPHTEAEVDQLLASGTVLFAVEIPANFERSVRRGDKPAMLVIADATDPVASGTALGALGEVLQMALSHDRDVPDKATMPFEIRIHARYNPAGVTQLNIVPGLVGTILTMTMLIFTALSVTREIERGTMESLLSMPITPFAIMLGKIVPYILVGFVQASLIIGIGVFLFGVPVVGNLAVLAALSTLVYRHQFVDRLHVFDVGTESIASDANVDDVFLADHLAVRVPVPVRGYADLGPIYRRGAAAHTFFAHCARDHAQRLEPVRSTLRCDRDVRADAGGYDHRCHQIPPHARLESFQNVEP